MSGLEKFVRSRRTPSLVLAVGVVLGVSLAAYARPPFKRTKKVPIQVALPPASAVTSPMPMPYTPNVEHGRKIFDGADPHAPPGGCRQCHACDANGVALGPNGATFTATQKSVTWFATPMIAANFAIADSLDKCSEDSGCWLSMDGETPCGSKGFTWQQQKATFGKLTPVDRYDLAAYLSSIGPQTFSIAGKAPKGTTIRVQSAYLKIHDVKVDEAGNFRMAGLPAGDYRVHVVGAAPGSKVYRLGLSVEQSYTDPQLDSGLPPIGSLEVAGFAFP